MGYNTKNYMEQGGDSWVIGGTLGFTDDAEFDNFPGAANVADDTGTTAKNTATLKAMLIALKNAQIMEGDTWNVSIASATLSNLPTEADATNNGHATITIADNVITIALNCKVSELADADHGASWGTHKWISMGIDTNLASIVGVVFDDGTAKVTLGDGDVSEATGVGLSSGEFILYIKAEKVFAQGGTFYLSGLGMKKTAFKLVVTEGD